MRGDCPQPLGLTSVAADLIDVVDRQDARQRVTKSGSSGADKVGIGTSSAGWCGNPSMRPLVPLVDPSIVWRLKILPMRPY